MDQNLDDVTKKKVRNTVFLSMTAFVSEEHQRTFLLLIRSTNKVFSRAFGLGWSSLQMQFNTWTTAVEVEMSPEVGIRCFNQMRLKKKKKKCSTIAAS